MDGEAQRGAERFDELFGLLMGHDERLIDLPQALDHESLKTERASNSH
jgi:hypothetical protein